MPGKKRSLYAYLCHKRKEVLRATSTPSCVEAKWVQSGIILAPFWHHFGTFWHHFGIIYGLTRPRLVILRWHHKSTGLDTGVCSFISSFSHYKLTCFSIVYYKLQSNKYEEKSSENVQHISRFKFGKFFWFTQIKWLFILGGK